MSFGFYYVVSLILIIHLLNVSLWMLHSYVICQTRRR